jgi:aminoglycoside phosphotransferase family enzyme
MAKTSIGPLQIKTFVNGSSGLMKEYTIKMRQLCEQAKSLDSQVCDGHTQPDRLKAHQRAMSEWRNMQDLVNRLQGPMQDLAQQVSQMIEHGKLSTLAKTRLRLRLAEFESAINLKNVIASCQPAFSAER